jgi:hypothetical protein
MGMWELLRLVEKVGFWGMEVKRRDRRGQVTGK